MTSNATAVTGHGTVKASKAEEMAAIDQLGPECRKALNHCVFEWSPIATLRQFKARNMVPLNPDHDKRMADELRGIDTKRAGVIRV